VTRPPERALIGFRPLFRSAPSGDWQIACLHLALISAHCSNSPLLGAGTATAGGATGGGAGIWDQTLGVRLRRAANPEQHLDHVFIARFPCLEFKWRSRRTDLHLA